MRKIAALAMALLALLALTGGSALAQTDYETTVHALNEQNNSGQSGTVTFSLAEDGTSVRVEINISGGSEVPQPAHIHTGTCDNLDPKPFYPLNSVVNGRSVTVITEADIANLDYDLYNQFSVNVHKSAAEAAVYVSCGEIVPGGNVTVGMPRTGGSDNMAPMLALAALALVAMGTVLSLARRKA
ncbi:MAG: CHRD domain-containing protein [Chloroflexota bacterium]|nr:CHRD domain-containing protein [Chloroflexota bacterium]